MSIREIQRIPAEVAAVLRNNKHVDYVDDHLVLLAVDFHLEIYREWEKVQSTEVIEEILMKNGFSRAVLGTPYAEALAWDFQTYGNPLIRPIGGPMAPHQPQERRNDVALLATGRFFMSGKSFKWNPEFRKELRACFPEMTVEDSLVQAGINPELIANPRIRALKHAFKVDFEKRQEALKDGQQDPGHESIAPPEKGDEAYRFLSNPYVKDVPSKCMLTMKEAFYNEAYYLHPLSTEKVLSIYGIDPAVLSTTCISRIRSKRYGWELTAQGIEEWTEEIIRIQMARLGAMEKITEEGFAKIRGSAKKLSPARKKELCRIIAEYPTQRDFPCGYSLRDILGKVGISKSVYYKALNDSRYGLADERRKARDCRDLEKIVMVMEYKGFEKGIRQVYMMMPDITGEAFAISKIRRLLRQAGIKTRVRGENPARQRMGKFMERNRKPNLLRREFRLHRPNEVRLTDVTYLDYGDEEEKQRAYGSSCIDPVTGRLLVFHVGESNDLELALGTLEKLSDHPAVEGALFHSDQGILYFTDEFQEKVSEMGMVQSMSKHGNCWDNAPQESFFGHFKDECGYGSCKTFEELQALVDEYAWYYNNERHQWDRKRMTPVQYEAYLLSLDEEGFGEYMRSEREKYDRMKEKAEKQAIERAKTLGV